MNFILDSSEFDFLSTSRSLFLALGIFSTKFFLGFITFFPAFKELPKYCALHTFYIIFTYMHTCCFVVYMMFKKSKYFQHSFPSSIPWTLFSSTLSSLLSYFNSKNIIQPSKFQDRWFLQIIMMTMACREHYMKEQHLELEQK